MSWMSFWQVPHGCQTRRKGDVEQAIHTTREKFTKAGLAEHLCAHFQREWRKSQGSKGECTAQQCLTLDHQSFIDSFCKKKSNKLFISPERTTCGSQRCRKPTRDLLACRKSYSWLETIILGVQENSSTKSAQTASQILAGLPFCKLWLTHEHCWISLQTASGGESLALLEQLTRGTSRSSRFSCKPYFLANFRLQCNGLPTRHSQRDFSCCWIDKMWTPGSSLHSTLLIWYENSMVTWLYGLVFERKRVN